MTNALLTLETIATYLSDKEIKYDIGDRNGYRFIRTGWDFGIGNANVMLSVITSSDDLTRLEITCMTQKLYPQSRRAEIVQLLNDRNRERPFGRSIAQDGTVWMEYVGFYPALAEMPRSTFDTLFGSLLMNFQDDYAALEYQHQV